NSRICGRRTWPFCARKSRAASGSVVRRRTTRAICPCPSGYPSTANKHGGRAPAQRRRRSQTRKDEGCWSMELIFLGTCSGTEPEPGRCHVAWVLLVDGALYWFDAGENCSRTAHLLGLDLLAVKAI